MKASSFIPGVAVMIAAASVALASNQTQTSSKKSEDQAKSAKTEKTEGIVLTGSYVKRNIHRTGLITDGPDNVLVIDRETINNSGAATLKEVLLRKGIR